MLESEQWFAVPNLIFSTSALHHSAARKICSV